MTLKENRGVSIIKFWEAIRILKTIRQMKIHINSINININYHKQASLSGSSTTLE